MKQPEKDVNMDKKMKAPSGKMYDKWEVECWADAVEKAQKIQKDEDKKALVLKCLEERKKCAIESIEELREVAKKKIGEY